MTTSSLGHLKDLFHGPQFRSFVMDLFNNLTTNLNLACKTNMDMENKDATNHKTGIQHSIDDTWDMLKLCLSVSTGKGNCSVCCGDSSDPYHETL